MKEIHVVGAAIMDGSRVLLGQRSPTMSMPLKWEFVGGKVEENETHRQALEREVYEELGVRAEVGRYVATGSSETKERKIILHVYEAKLTEGSPVAREHLQIEWVEVDRLGELDWPEADMPACKRLMQLYAAN